MSARVEEERRHSLLRLFWCLTIQYSQLKQRAACQQINMLNKADEHTHLHELITPWWFWAIHCGSFPVLKWATAATDNSKKLLRHGVFAILVVSSCSATVFICLSLCYRALGVPIRKPSVIASAIIFKPGALADLKVFIQWTHNKGRYPREISGTWIHKDCDTRWSKRHSWIVLEL